MARAMQLVHAWEIILPEIYYLVGLVVGVLQGILGIRKVACKATTKPHAPSAPMVVSTKQPDATAHITPKPAQIPSSNEKITQQQQQQQQSSSPKIVVKHHPAANSGQGTKISATHGAGRKKGRKQKN